MAKTRKRSASQPTGNDVPRFGMFEQSFEHSGAYANPYAQAAATATLRRPDRSKWTIPLFWDGGKNWRLRVSPDLAGDWSYSIRSEDAGLNGRSGSFRCVASGLRGSIQPMKGHPLHFQYQDGTRMWFFGEKAWRVLQAEPAKRLNHETAMHHVDVRAAQGFNYMHTELAGTGGVEGGGNEGGELFLDAGKEVVNPAFLQEVDTRLRHINDQGMVFGLVVLYALGNPYWRSLPTHEARLRFARYVVARYAAFHVVFLVTGEWQYMLGEEEFFRSVGREIRRTDPHGRMIGIHPGPSPIGVSSQEYADDDWMSFGEYAQAYFAFGRQEANDAHRNELRKFLKDARRHGKPVVAAEYAYYLRDADGDGIVDKEHSHTRTSFRRASWVIPMAGAYFVTGFGSTYFGGRREPGPFLVDNPRYADGLADLDRLRRFFTSLPWWTLEPRDERVRADGGYAYCLTDGKGVCVVYLAGARGADLELPRGRFVISRFDPRTGESVPLPPAHGRSVRLEAPDKQDWVFRAMGVHPRRP
jgi:hypothetical protein